MESCIGGYCYRKCHISDDCPNNFMCHSSHCVLICERNEECLGHQRCLLDSGTCTGKTQPETELEIGKGEMYMTIMHNHQVVLGLCAARSITDIGTLS